MRGLSRGPSVSQPQTPHLEQFLPIPTLGCDGGARLISGAVIGVVLGLSLGFLRYLSAGLFAPWVAHAFANVAIVFAVRAG